GPRYLEGWRAQQPHALVDLALDRDHDLGAEEAIVARLSARLIVDVITHEVSRPDRSARQAKRSARDLIIEDVQTVGDHRAGAHGCQEGICGRHLAAEIRPGLYHGREAIAGPPQEVHDVGAVIEEHWATPHAAQSH